MTEPTPGGARQYRADLRRRAEKMISHLRTEVLPVPGRRAAVRAALGHEPGTPRTFAVYREISDFLPGVPSRRQERAFIAVAALLCAQPASNRKQEIAAADVSGDTETEPGPRGQRSLGDRYARAVNYGRVREATAEARLHQLCRGDAAGVHRQLPGLVHQLRDIGIPIDWVALIDDLAGWDIARDHIAALWFREFYRARTARSAPTPPSDTDHSQEDPA